MQITGPEYMQTHPKPARQARLVLERLDLLADRHVNISSEVVVEGDRIVLLWNLPHAIVRLGCGERDITVGLSTPTGDTFSVDDVKYDGELTVCGPVLDNALHHIHSYHPVMHTRMSDVVSALMDCRQVVQAHTPHGLKKVFTEHAAAYHLAMRGGMYIAPIMQRFAD